MSEKDVSPKGIPNNFGSREMKGTMYFSESNPAIIFFFFGGGEGGGGGESVAVRDTFALLLSLFVRTFARSQASYNKQTMNGDSKNFTAIFSRSPQNLNLVIDCFVEQQTNELKAGSS